MLTKHRLLILLASFLLASAASAAEIYKWVDDQGRTHASDTVPEKYRGVAKRIDSQQFEVSPEEREAAEQRAAALKAEAAESAARLKAEQRQRARAARISARNASATANAASSPAALDCTTLRSQFAQSKDCFARYTMANGALAPGAFQACGPDLQDPAPKCGQEPAR